MAIKPFMKALLLRVLPLLAVLAVLLSALYLAADATSAVSQSSRYYLWALGGTSVALVVVFLFLGRRVLRLIRKLRKNAPGARLNLRLSLIFVALSVPPAAVVYWFSVEFISDSIDQWFDVEVREAMRDAEEIGQIYLRSLERDANSRVGDLAIDVSLSDSPRQELQDFVLDTGAISAMIFDQNGRVAHIASFSSLDLNPNLPDRSVLIRVEQGGTYVKAEPIDGGQLQIRAVAPVRATAFGEGSMVQALFPVPDDYASLAENVQAQYLKYEQLNFLRIVLRQSYVLILSLVLVLSVLMAMLMAFTTSKRLVAPVAKLADATMSVASGDYEKQLKVSTNDDLGFLVRSFNRMTSALAEASAKEAEHLEKIETQRRYQETLLERMSSGVLGIDAEHHLRTFNNAAAEILKVDLSSFLARPIALLVEQHPHLKPLISQFDTPHSKQSWRQELVLPMQQDKRVLICRGTHLPEQSGTMLLFDDATILDQAQREAAWGEVARRLAHEVKNPLTPIQLASERIRQKYMGKLEESDAQSLEKLTGTIVAQVNALKGLVNAFGDYAKQPELHIRRVDIRELVESVLILYADQVQADLQIDATLQEVLVDQDRFRQLLHNLIKNAIEARQGDVVKFHIQVMPHQWRGSSFARFRFMDDGPGIAQDMMDRIFEPYATSKPKGSGLGLAIVRKIVEEHGGRLKLCKSDLGGAGLEVLLPVPPALHDQPD